MSALKKTLITEVAAQLKANPRRQRFLTELQDHLEDAENEQAIGEIPVVCNAFNKYAVAHTRLVFYRTLIIALVVAGWSGLAMIIVYSNGGEVSGPVGFLAIPGWFLSVPIALPGALLSVLIFASSGTLEAAVPYLLIICVILTTIFWTTVAFMLQSNPPKLLQKFSGKPPDKQIS